MLLLVRGMSYFENHAWVGFATLWLLWPLVLAVHVGRSFLRVIIPLAISLIVLVPSLRNYPLMARVTFGLPLIHYEVTYYDRNNDGIVDFEFHHAPNAWDADWSLADTQFHGRYDLKIDHSPFGGKHPVDLPVPRRVQITRGEPQLWRVR